MKNNFKKSLKSYIAGFLSATVLASGSVFAYETVRIFIDNKELVATDVNGKRVDPIVIDGTTYLPVRAIANAFGKAVYWDGPNSTVYLGEMGGNAQYPTETLENVDNIGDYFDKISSDKLTDNYGNSYSYATKIGYYNGTFQTLLNMKYSRFKCTIYVPKGCSSDNTAKILIKTDGKVVWSSPEITKTSSPIDVDIDIRGCNDFQIEVTRGKELGYIADGGFYQ